MPLAPGTRLGPYEITEPIGKGGMGEVYKAHDTRLRRDVAIKTSAQRFSARFELEARAIAALNHPNICQIYDVGPDYIVMELVEGPTLGERIKQGAIPPEEAEAIAMQVTLALEAAHEKKITHRDLKPGNVKVKADGVVKVLDFGLAKVGQALPPDTLGEDSPTLTMGMGLTEAGMILGTAAYMAPEQAKGKPVDHRADIWAFGVVLYEMLTGKRLFTGEDLADVLASVVKDTPDLTVVPKRFRKLVQACLQKDPAKRLQSIGDAKLLLTDEESVALPAPLRSRFGAVGWIAAGVMAAAAGLALWAPWKDVSAELPLMRVSIPLPTKAGSTLGSGLFGLSPDGKRLAVRWSENGQTTIAIREMDSEEYRLLLSGVENPRDAYWSRDGRFIAFVSNIDQKLKLVPAAGGPVQDLCSELGTGNGVSWRSDGVLLFGSAVGPIRKVTVVNGSASGSCTPVTKLETPTTPHRYPQFTSDGNHFLYSTGVGAQRTLMVAALDGPDTPARKVMLADTQVNYFPAGPGEKYAHLMFPRDRSLMVQDFDDASLQVVGDPVELLPRFAGSAADRMSYSISDGGMLLFNPESVTDAQLKWFDRSGKELGIVGQYQGPFALSLAPDDTRALTGRDNGGGQWAYDLLGNGPPSRFDERTFGNVVWSANGERIAYGYETKLFRARPTGEQEELLHEAKNPVKPSQWSADGKFLFYTENDPKTHGDIWYLPEPGGTVGKPVKFLATEAQESQAQLSPDGRWLAYTSDETGRNEVYVQPFPQGAKLRISRNGASTPRWRADGAELFFLEQSSPRNLLSSVPPAFVPKPLFSFQALTYLIALNTYTYAPTKDGQRFLVGELRPRSPVSALTLITDWRKLLK